MKIAICDDNENDIKIIRDMLKAVAPHDNVVEFLSGFAMLDYVSNAKNMIDVLILDMKLPHIDGLETANELRQTMPHLAIIIMTAHPKEYALSGYRIFPVNFLSKPVKPEILEQSLKRAKQYIDEDYLLLQSKGSMRYVHPYEIYYIESAGMQIQFTLGDGSYCIYQWLDYYEQWLLSKGFFRIHRKTIVNLEYVKEVREASLLMYDGKELQIAKRRKGALMSALTKWRKVYA